MKKTGVALAKLERLGEDRVIEEIHKAKGVLYRVAISLWVDRYVLESYLAEHDAVAEVVADWVERMGDIAEEQLFRQIKAGDIKAITYYLSTKHKHRGYGLKFDVNLQSGQSLDKDVVSTREVLNALEAMSIKLMSDKEAQSNIIDITPKIKPNGTGTNGAG